jgi:hypothetical protein
VGRYLYRLPGQWVDYDAHKRQFVRPPVLPPSALPKLPEKPAPPKSPPAAQKPAPKQGLHTLPANGVELQRRLYDYDKRLAAQGLCAEGDLVKRVVAAGVKAGLDGDLSTWTAQGIVLAVDQTKAFEAEARQRAKEKKDVA